MGSLSPGHWLVVLVVLLLVFGPKRVAAAGKGLGEGLRGFRQALGEREDAPGRDREARTTEADS